MENYTPINPSPKPANATKKKPVFKYLFRVLLMIIALAGSAYFVNHYIFQSKATNDIATISFTPQNPTVSLNENYAQGIRINTGTQKVTAVDLSITYDSTYFTYVPIKTLGSDSYFTETVMQDISGTGAEKTLRFVAVVNRKDSELLSNILFSINFKAIKETSSATKIALNELKSKIVGTTGATELFDHQFDINSDAATATIIIGKTIACTNDSACGANGQCGSTGNCSCKSGFYNCDADWTNGCESPTTCNTAGGIKLQLSVKFQGISKSLPEGTANTVRLKVVGGNGNSQEIENVPLQATTVSNGIFIATVDLDKLKPASDFQIFLKGPKHVQKRFCTLKPTGAENYHCTGAERIALTSGTNVADFSTVPLLSGDLPIPTQDGVLNSQDIGSIKDCIKSPNAECVKKTDINLDGATNGSDFTLVLASMALKYDDEN